MVALASFKLHFAGERFIVNADLPAKWTAFKKPDPSDAVQGADLSIVESIRETARKGESLRVSPNIPPDLSHRFLAKVALAAGFKALGRDFLETDYAKCLRQGFREVRPEKRRNLPIRGSGYFGPAGLGGAEDIIKWPGAWVLCLLVMGGTLSLTVVTPAGRSMIILVCEDASLLEKLGKFERDGRVWVTIPALGEAAGPVSFPEYLAHQTNSMQHPALAALAARRIDPSSLPPCRPPGQEGFSPED